MGHVQNVSEDTLGWQGMVIAPGEIVEVRDGLAETMQRQTGGKFKVVTVEEAKAHRHRYEDGSDVCTVDDCDHIKRGSAAANGETSGSGASNEGENPEGGDGDSEIDPPANSPGDSDGEGDGNPEG